MDLPLESGEVSTGGGAAAAALAAPINFSAASRGAADQQDASSGVTAPQSTIRGAASSNSTNKVLATDHEMSMITLAISTQKQFLTIIKEAQGPSEYRPCLKEFMRVTEISLRKLERVQSRETKQKEAAAARRRSTEASADYKQACAKAQEARARIDDAEDEAQRLEQECATLMDTSSRDSSPESASSKRSRSTPRKS
jgi:hypothetical protein